MPGPKSICNNDVTYADHWDTPENRWYKKQAMKYANRSHCESSIPLSWAREVYFFLKELDDKFGIQYAQDTYRGYYVPDRKEFLYLLFVSPIRRLPGTLKAMFKDVFNPSKYKLKSSPTVLGRWNETLFEFRGSTLHAWSMLAFLIRGYIHNKRTKPQVNLSQFKEKYGYVTIYYQAPTEASFWIDNRRKILERDLSRKGAYYDLDQIP